MVEQRTLQEHAPGLSHKDKAIYAYKALSRLAGAWTKTTKGGPNYSGMRAAFRRFKPEASGEPTMEMRQYIWGWIGSPFAPLADGTDDGSEVRQTEDQPSPPPVEETEGEKQANRSEEFRRERSELETIDQAAVIVAMRAASGDHDSDLKLGQAFYKAGMNDRRLMRLLTAGKDARMAALHRALRLVDGKKLGVDWTIEEVGNTLAFLYGSDRVAQRAGNQWASDFFRMRNLGRNKGEANEKSEE